MEAKFKFMSGKIKTTLALLVFILLTGSIMALSPVAVSESADTSTVWSNTTFLILFCIVTFLLIIIVVLASVLKSIGSLFKSKNSGALFKTLATLILLGSSTNPLSAASWNYGGITPFTFYFMITIILFEVVVIGVMINLIFFLLKREEVEKKSVVEIKEVSIFEKMTASVPVEREEEIMFDHEYDGIRELDNDLPPWWKYGFYITIVVGVIYFAHYHFTRTGELQTEEYNTELKLADAAMAEYRAKAANMVDETNVTLLTDASSIEKGKVLYENCFACHGKLGEGGVGPNLTDDYWVYGGDIKNIFKTIKYGTEKGMKSWKDEFSPLQISQLSSFVKTLRGTNPPNAKEPQGDLYVEGSKSTTPALSDSLQIKNSDSTTVAVVDTTK